MLPLHPKPVRRFQPGRKNALQAFLFGSMGCSLQSANNLENHSVPDRFSAHLVEAGHGQVFFATVSRNLRVPRFLSADSSPQGRSKRREDLCSGLLQRGRAGAAMKVIRMLQRAEEHGFAVDRDGLGRVSPSDARWTRPRQTAAAAREFFGAGLFVNPRPN